MKCHDLNQILNCPSEPPISALMRRALMEQNLISLAAGLADVNFGPSAEIAGFAAEAFRKDAAQVLQYTSTEGRQDLREALAASQNETDSNAYVITNGGQQALDLIARSVLQPGDIVLLESPSYYVFTHALQSRGVKGVHLRTDSEGICPMHLAEILHLAQQEGWAHRIRLLYTIPYAHNPRAHHWSFERKKQILALWLDWLLAIKNQGGFAWLLEDSAYRDLSFDRMGNSVTSPGRFRDILEETPVFLQELGSQTCIEVGSWSKSFAPGLKLGWCRIGDEKLRTAVIRHKANEDFGSSSLSQAILVEAYAQKRVDAIAQNWASHYGTKAKWMLDALDASVKRDHGLHWRRPDGGMYVWLEWEQGGGLPSAAVLSESLASAGVLVVPGSLGFLGETPQGQPEGLRLSFGLATREQIEVGVERLGAVLRV
jgi:2-aminoadipate transaminase